VAPDSRPLERVFGPELGTHIRRLHEDKGVIFHLGRTTASIAEKSVTLDDGAFIPRTSSLSGSVRPATALAERAGLVINQGVQVDQFLETSLPGVFAAETSRAGRTRTAEATSGSSTGWSPSDRAKPRRATSWGQGVVRRGALLLEPALRHEDQLRGHAERWDGIERHHGLPQGGWEERYMAGGVPLAVATIGRDRESLEAEYRLEHVRAQRQAARTGSRHPRAGTAAVNLRTQTLPLEGFGVKSTKAEVEIRVLTLGGV
jgi:hypothetical protein